MGPDGTAECVLPTSAPRTEDFTHRGFTEVLRKKVGPTWTLTLSMREHDPSLPDWIAPGPVNPVGTHVMCLGWPFLLIRGTHENSRTGRP
jgi:lipoprotein-anchoring transpeptidase ErfK/SrfK